MKEDTDKTIVEFNNEAARLYGHVFDQFENSVRNIDRNNEENVFQMRVSKFSLELKKQLEQHVKKILESSDSKMNEQLQAALSVKVSYYLRQFMQKCSAM